MLTRDLARHLDPVIFASDAGVVCDAWQAKFLRSSSPRVLQLAARQVGKTTGTAIKALHVAVHEPGALVAVVCPAQRQSSEFVRTMRLLHQHLDGSVGLKAESVTKLEFENEARILALPGGEEGKTIRGLAGARLIVLDEAAQIPDEVLAAVRPMMATNPKAELIALSTPFGRRGWFYEAWNSNDPIWSRVKVTVDQCPRITQEFLEEERKALGQTMFESEYGLIFHDSDTAAFNSSIIDAAFDPAVRPLWF